MSELFNPRRTQDTPQESSPTSTPNRPIGHSGDLGLEFPQSEHLELTSRAPLEKVADDLRMPRSPGDLERKPRLKPSRKQKLLGSLAGLTLVTGAVVGGVALANQGEETPAPEPGNSAEPFPDDVEEVPVVDIPKEAQSFVESYGDRYQDPVATYYAEEEYKRLNGGLSTTLSDEYVRDYTFPSISSGELSLLGGPSPEYTLASMKLAPGAEINNNTFIELFNESAVPNLNRYMNLVAKNTSLEAREVINNEFKIYVSPSSETANNLMDTLTSIVDSYGSNAVYEVSPVTEGGAEETSIIPEHSTTTIDTVDEENNIVSFGNTIQPLAIKVTTFDSSNIANTTTHIVEHTEIVFTYDPITGPKDQPHPGYISIGQR